MHDDTVNEDSPDQQQQTLEPAEQELRILRIRLGHVVFLPKVAPVHPA